MKLRVLWQDGSHHVALALYGNPVKFTFGTVLRQFKWNKTLPVMCGACADPSSQTSSPASTRLSCVVHSFCLLVP